MKILIADKVHPSAISGLENLGHEVTLNPACTSDDLHEHLAGVEALNHDGEGVLLLVHFTNLVGMDKASRKFVNTEKMVLAHKACAMYVTSPLAKLIANFFLGINRPNFIISSFTDEDSAKKWLLKQKSFN